MTGSTASASIDLVPARGELVGDGLAEAGLENQRRRREAAAGRAVRPARRFHRRLQAQTEVEQPVQQLQAGLRLPVRAARAKRQPRLAIAQRKAGHERVQRPFPGASAFGCPGSRLKPKPRLCSVTPVPGHVHARAERGVQALDQADHVAVAVGGAQIDRVAVDRASDQPLRWLRGASAQYGRRCSRRTVASSRRSTGTSRKAPDRPRTRRGRRTPASCARPAGEPVRPSPCPRRRDRPRPSMFSICSSATPWQLGGSWQTRTPR